MFCSVCGSRLEEGSKYCMACGQPVQNESPPGGAPYNSSGMSYGTPPGNRMVYHAPQQYGRARLGITIALCVLLFLAASAATVVYLLRNSFSDDNIDKIISEVDVVTLLDELGLYDSIVDAIACDKNDTVDETDTALSTDGEEDEEDEATLLRRIFEDEAVRDFVADNVTDYVGDLIRGDREVSITRDDVLSFVGRSAGLIQEKIEDRLNEDENADYYEEIEEYIRQIDRIELSDDDGIGISLPSSTSTVQINTDFLKIPLSPYTMPVLLAISILAFAGLFVVNLKYVKKALLGSSISLIGVGLLCLMCSLMLYSIVWELSGGAFSRSLSEMFLFPTRSTGILISLVVLTAGILLLLAFAAVSMLKKKPAAYDSSQPNDYGNWQMPYR